MIEDDFKYFKEFINDSTPVDMKEGIDFYDSVYSNKNIDEGTKEIRDYANKHCGMEQAMSNLINHIKG